MPTITPFLWFNDNAEEAMQFYASVFPTSMVRSVHRAQGKVMSVEFEIEGQRFMGLNGGPHYTFNEAVSFFVSCETQAEVDRLWTALTADGGQPGRCGWLKDKFGLSWQVVPRTLGALLSGGGDPARAGRVTQAMLQMSKLDLQQLQQAYDEALPSR
jgi:predicted 3-demethylubiquinone-9 3-methyltransferase (glyoxalase superfamily)